MPDQATGTATETDSARGASRQAGIAAMNMVGAWYPALATESAVTKSVVDKPSVFLASANGLFGTFGESRGRAQRLNCGPGFRLPVRRANATNRIQRVHTWTV